MDEKTLSLFYTGAAVYLNLGSEEVDQSLADAGLDPERDDLDLCRRAIRDYVDGDAWDAGRKAGRLLFGNGTLTVADAPPGTELITLAEAARLRGVSVQAISQAVNRGSLTAYHDYSSPNPQRGRRLVSRREILEM